MAEEVTVNQLPPSGLDQTEVTQLVEYIMGSESKPPEALDKMMTNLYQKLQMGLGYSVASNVMRQTKLAKFLARVEDNIFNISDEELNNMPKEELEKLYTSASKALGEMNEFERRFLAQNKEIFNTKLTEQERIAQQLMTLPQDKIEAVMKIIQGEKDMQEDTSAENILEDV